MSGRGRKQPNRRSRARTSQPSARKKPPSAPGPSSQAGVAAHPRPEPEGLKGLGSSASRIPVAPQRSTASARRPSSAGAGPSRPASRSFRAGRRKRNQKIGVIVAALALAGAAAGSILVGQAGDPTPAASTGATAEVQAVTPTTPAPAAPPTAGAPSPAPPAPDQAAATAAAPTMTMTCPTGAGASPRFGNEISAPTPYEVTIDYGDGDVYTDTSNRLGAIFSHTYQRPGTYQVSAVLTDPAGRTTNAACTYTWGP